MHAHQDAFGKAVYDFHQHGRGYEILERNDGFIESTEGPQCWFAEYRQWLPHERRAMRYIHGCVLDVGCGAGRYALWLQRKGHDVVGIDASPLAIRVCRLRGVKRAKVASVAQFKAASGTFGTILMMGNGFGMAGSPDATRWLLRKFQRMTAASGRILAESLNPYETDDPVHKAYHRSNQEHGRMRGQLRLRVRYREFATSWFNWLMCSQDEMQRILQGTGWVVRRFLGSYGPRYVAVIEKEHD
jgi:SAM-dependent methyltransferase